MTNAHNTPSAFVETSADRPSAAETAAPPAHALVSINEPETSTAIPPIVPPSTPYDPADYRWVPVRRRARYDGWTEEKQRRFIEVLADTGRVAIAVKAVGLSRQAAYALKRSAEGAAFARAWDAARLHAGALLEDIAFDRAIEGRAENVFDKTGEVIATKHVPDNRLLTFLLKNLLPERYGNAAAPAIGATPDVTVDACLRAMEPQLPAPAEALLGAETLSGELEIADIADGRLPHFLNETRPEKTEAQLAAEQYARGKAACEKADRHEHLSREEFADMCFYIDPTSAPKKATPAPPP